MTLCHRQISAHARVASLSAGLVLVLGPALVHVESSCVAFVVCSVVLLFVCCVVLCCVVLCVVLRVVPCFVTFLVLALRCVVVSIYIHMCVRMSVCAYTHNDIYTQCVWCVIYAYTHTSTYAT